ncbi:ABC transporter ATP-binding protein [Canibacter sp. lx-72]|uniref:ABC transporter ATP-binding protein n=1 Tax=Canibacter zhuwentaonis TaxID=2837491 RepID=UPI001BDCEA1F|nr:ABC transporter ATP-binding protein [Canibacter zhuwentaonis]MBT1018272.1 ABC transporter ATP-binding protein [Canibacter zhuwentaonis]MBT1035282.1 ABC transporter ATP-binding protein [Canibacter zhuwentaonis]
MSVLKLRDVHKTYESANVYALRGVSLTVAVGEFVAIVGQSGSGKSTLLQCAAGLDNVNKGSVAIGGKTITGLSDNELTRVRRDHVGFVFQSYNLFPAKTVKENILYPLKLQRKKLDSEFFNSIVKQLGISELLDRYPSLISGGQQQRVAVARSLISSPSIIFADEPTGALDSASSRDLLVLLRKSVNDFGQSVLVVTHDTEVAEYADRVIHMVDGQISKIVNNTSRS